MRLEGSSGFGVGAMANSVRLRWGLKMEIKEGGEGPWTKAQTRGIGYRDDGLSVDQRREQRSVACRNMMRGRSVDGRSRSG